MAGLIDSAALFETVLETVPDACVVFDHDLRVVFANRRAREYVGLTRDEIVGRSHEDLWPDAVEAMNDRLRNVLATGEPLRAEAFYPRYDGWFEITATPIPTGVSVFFRDISATKRTEAALSLSEGRYREMLVQSPLSVQILTPEGWTRWINSTFTRLWGATLEDLRDYNILQDPQIEELGLLEPLKRAFAGEVVVLPRRRYDASRVLPHLGVREVRAMAYPIRNAAGEIVEVVLTHEDVTEVAESEERLAAQERQLRAALEGIGAGRWEIDVETDQLSWSPEQYELLNLPPSEPPSLERFLSLLHPVDREAALRAMQRALATNGAINAEFRAQIPGRGQRWIACVGRVIADADGVARRVVGINFDVTDRVETEAALERTERSLALAMKGGRMGYWTRDLSGDETKISDRVEWSPELEEVFGLPPGGFGGTEEAFFDLIHPEDRTVLAQAVERSIREGSDYTVAFRFRHRDGTWHWMEGRGRATYDDSGRPLRLDGIGIDITAQKRTESTLRLLVQLSEATRAEDDPRQIIATSELLLRNHLGANRCAYAEVEEDNDHFTVEMDVCDGCPSIVGRYSLAAFGERALRELREGKPYVCRDIEAEAPPPEVLEAYRLTQIRSVICVSLVKDGRMVALMAVHQTKPRDWTDSEIALVQMIADRCWSDIARARANRRLAASESQYREIAETLPQLVWCTRADGYHDYFNSRWYDFTGVRLGATDGGAWGDILHPDDLPRTVEAWSRCLETGDPYEIEYRLRGRDGAYRWFLGRALPIRDGEGRIVRWFGTCTDIHEQKEAEAELEARVQARTAELQAANRELEGFTYTVSHDLRSPLRAIMATSMILLEEAAETLAADQRELLARQAHNARRLGILIDDLLQMSRLGRKEMRRTTVDLATLAREVVAELQEDGRGSRFRFEIAETLPAQGDPNLLRFVLLNLLENATKFSPKEGTITVGLTEDGAFFVRDEGIGFDPRYAHKLFLPFERLVTDSEYPGTGIGLANVKRIVDRHGGRVWAEAQLGRGATFFFTLPE